MLAHTFVHIPGIGPQTERSLWRAGITSWDHAVDFSRTFGVLPAGLQSRLREFIPRSKGAVESRDAGFFARLNHIGESWRALPDFREDCVFFDIETTGLSPAFDSITIAGLYDGRDYRVLVGDEIRHLPNELAKYKMVVTYNGAGFDLRFFRLRFPDAVLPPLHVDLRWLARRAGYKGGLKALEVALGLKRNDDVAELTGKDAVVLWSDYQRGNGKALEKLIEYNAEDVIHLKAAAEMLYEKIGASLFPEQVRHSKGFGFAGIASRPKDPSVSCRQSVSPSGEIGIVQQMLRSCDRTPVIVGIDLTGSERRPTGWSVLRGDVAETALIRTDEELIRLTLAARPDIVSIDSPLSLPAPRALAGSDSAGTIYRHCELALKRMGISVFWCLLPSMRSLTFRGMRLAAAMRDQGLIVIESYPGAAQDVLAIPRKGTSIIELKRGLQRSGISGNFADSKVSHDELDAITSALVGLFYIVGDYIALGNAEEDYLIIPRTPRINYTYLSAIAARSGLDPIPLPAPTC